MLHWLKTTWIDRFDPDYGFLKQAIRTGLATLIAVILYRTQQVSWPQGYWMILAAAFLMQTRIGNTHAQQLMAMAIKIVLAAGFATLVALAAAHIWLLALLLALTTFIAVYVGVMGHVFAVGGFFVNLFIIMSAGLQTGPEQLLQRFSMILLGGAIAWCMAWLWPLRGKVTEGAAHHVKVAALRMQWHLSAVSLRRAVRMAIAMFLAVLLYRYANLTQGFWVPLTLSIVMQGTTEETLRKGMHRVLGTLLGVLIGSLLMLGLHDYPWVIDALLVLTIFIAYSMKSLMNYQYALFVIPLTVMVVMLVSAVAPQESHALIIARVYDTLIGAVLGVLVTVLILPSRKVATTPH